jgi:3-methyladenine DNA glycosylase AlkD
MPTPSETILEILQKVQMQASPERAQQSLKFFKTGPGQYGEGDQFIGLTNQQVRDLAKQYFKIDWEDVQQLMVSKIHEHRMLALLILLEKYKKGHLRERRFIVEFYVQHLPYINNWDLVDLSARDIVGHFLLDKDPELLYILAQSGHLWSERVAVIASWAFIKKNDFSHTLRLSEQFLSHPHDLMHKACGWMLREVGKRDKMILVNFIQAHLTIMARTMLRYSIEKMEETERQEFLKK